MVLSLLYVFYIGGSVALRVENLRVKSQAEYPRASPKAQTRGVQRQDDSSACRDFKYHS